MRKRFAITLLVVALITLGLSAFHLPRVLAQWGSGGVYTVPSGGLYLNCPPGSCSVSGQNLNFPGLSAFQVLTADYGTTSSSTTLINAGSLSFPLAANEVGHLDCEIYFTNASGGGFDLALNGPGTPTQVTIRGSIATTSGAPGPLISQSALWQQVLAGGTSTVTTIQPAHIYATIENGATAGTLNVQFSDFNTTGPTTVKRDSWCSFP